MDRAAAVIVTAIAAAELQHDVFGIYQSLTI